MIELDYTGIEGLFKYLIVTIINGY